MSRRYLQLVAAAASRRLAGQELAGERRVHRGARLQRGLVQLELCVVQAVHRAEFLVPDAQEQEGAPRNRPADEGKVLACATAPASYSDACEKQCCDETKANDGA